MVERVHWFADEVAPIPHELARTLEPSGAIIPGRRAAAEQAWKDALSELRATPSEFAAERLVWLTAALYDPRFDPVSNRAEAYAELVAAVGSAREAVGLPRHQHLLAALLSRAAAGAHELEQASAWIGACDPDLDEPECRASFRLARATLFAHQGEWRRLLGAIGESSKDDPNTQRYLIDLALLRAGALEQTERHAEATAALLSALGRAGTAGARKLCWLLEAHRRDGLELAPRAHPQARLEFAKASAARARRWHGGWLLSFVMAAITTLIGSIAWLFGAESGPSFAMIGVLGSLVGFFLLFAARRDARRRAFGTPTVGRVQSAVPTGNKLNEFHQYRLALNVLFDRGYRTITTKYYVHPMHLGRMTPGTLLPVRADGPKRLVLELD